MKPLTLEISGLNSFKEKQTIDFQLLTRTGIFGIFGPTGSGKSTILDAVSLALFDEIPRKSKDFVNSESDKAFIGYEFKLNNNLHRIERTYKKNGQTYKCRYLVNGTPVSEKVSEVNKHIQEVIGLKSDDFFRCVVLPQGKFSELLTNTSPLERASMLERIFGLDKYGDSLARKLKTRKDAKELKLSELKGKASNFESISEKIIEELKNTENNLMISLDKKKKEFSELKLKKNEADEIIKIIAQLDSVIEKKAVILKNEEYIKTQKEKIELIEKSLLIKPHINESEKISEQLKSTVLMMKESEIKNKSAEEKSIVIETALKTAAEEKDKKIPELLNLKSNLEKALEISENIKSLNNAIKELSENLNRIQNEKVKSETELKNQSVKKDELEKEISQKKELLIKNREELKIKDTVYEMILMEKELVSLKHKEMELAESLKKLDEMIISEKNEAENLNNKNIQLLQKKELYIKNRETKKDLIKNLGEKIDEQKQIKNETMPKLIQLETDEKELKKLNETIILLSEIYEKSKVKLESSEKTLSDTKSRIRIVENELNLNYAYKLSFTLSDGEKCPVCGSIHHPEPAHITAQKDTGSLEETLESLKKQLTDEETHNKKESELLYKTEAELTTAKESAKSLITKINGQTSSELKERFNKNNAALEETIKTLETENKLSEQINQDLETLNSVISETENKISEKKANLKNNSTNKEKNETEIKKITDEITKKLNEYKELLNRTGINKPSEKYSQLKKIQEQNEEIEKFISAKEDELKLMTLKLEEINNSIVNHKINIEKYNSSSELTKKSLEESVEKFKSLYSGDDLQRDILTTKKNIKDIQEKYEDLAKEHDELLKLRDNAKTELIKLKSDEESLRKSLAEKKELIEKLLKENNIEYNDVNTHYPIKDSLEKIKTEVSEHEKDKNITFRKYEELNERIQQSTIKRDETDKINSEFASLEENIKSVEKELITIQNDLTQKESSLNEKNKITKELSIIEKEFSNLSELESLIKGKAFVKYIASKQLEHIIRAASERLKKISRGRYALEADETGTFYIRDDFRGGARRSPNSLSGGETFLASLSLALALSSQIQLKGNTQLEFFFLDEGFGTLDSELLDIVMNTLETLHSNRLSIGLISHVEELKQRIPVKLIVSPSDDYSGTRVSIDYQ